MKRRAGKNQKITKGMPSAVALSILIHVALFLLAGMLVVFTVVKKEEKKFIPPKAVERPKMKLRKPKVKVKKSAKPKPTTRIVTKLNRASMPDIQLPEMSGMTAGLGGGITGFDLMPDFGKVSVFGGGQSIGNDFEGVLYDLKRDRQGRKNIMSDDLFREELRDFVLSGWKPSELSRYYHSPKKLYTTHFMMPPLPSPMAPDVFGESQMPCNLFALHYQGKLVSNKPITFRFWANGNAFIFVRVDGKEVLVACWEQHKEYFDWWHSTDADSGKYYLGGQKATIGDWITLEPGQPLDMDVMFGEWRGGYMAAMLTVEVQGEEYESNRQGGPILPAFKTAEFSKDLIDEIERFLPPQEASLTNGPIFRDYDLPSITGTNHSDTTEQPTVAEAMPVGHSAGNKMRTWTLVDGRTFDAEFATLLANRVSLRNSKGKLLKISPEKLSPEDLEFIQLEMPPLLDLSFSKQSSQRSYPIVEGAMEQKTPTSVNYVFGAKVEQTSPGSYDHELQAELFVIGVEVAGNKYILLDHQKDSFMLNKENQGYFELRGDPVEVSDYELRGQFRGVKYGSYLLLITDSRGKIIAYKTPKKWLFQNRGNLKKLSVGNYFDKSCTRVTPTPPKAFFY